MTKRITLEDVALATGTPIDELRSSIHKKSVEHQIFRDKEKFLYMVRHILAQHGRCAMYLSKTGRILFVDTKQLKEKWCFSDRGTHLRGRPSNRSGGQKTHIQKLVH